MAAVAIHVATAAVLAASIAASLASAGDRVTGTPTRLSEPSTIVRPAADPVRVEPIPEPSPAGA
jgi:hypothetical protein